MLKYFLCFLGLLGFLYFPVVGPAYDTNKDIQIKLEEGVLERKGGEFFDIVQVGTPISSHVIIIPTRSYRADGRDEQGNKICFYYIDFQNEIKAYISSVPQDPIDILAEGNEVYLMYLLEVSRVAETDGGLVEIINRCKHSQAVGLGIKPSLETDETGILEDFGEDEN